MNYRYAIEDSIKGFPRAQRDFTTEFLIPRFARVGHGNQYKPWHLTNKAHSSKITDIESYKESE